jgi:hypothetical protein
MSKLARNQLPGKLRITVEPFAASDEVPYTAKLKGVMAIGCGNSPEEAYQDLIKTLNDQARVVAKVLEAVKEEKG